MYLSIAWQWYDSAWAVNYIMRSFWWHNKKVVGPCSSLLCQFVCLFYVLLCHLYLQCFLIQSYFREYCKFIISIFNLLKRIANNLAKKTQNAIQSFTWRDAPEAAKSYVWGQKEIGPSITLCALSLVLCCRRSNTSSIIQDLSKQLIILHW